MGDAAAAAASQVGGRAPRIQASQGRRAVQADASADEHGRWQNALVRPPGGSSLEPYPVRSIGKNREENIWLTSGLV